MNDITIVIIGTIHGTDDEIELFDKLNNISKNILYSDFCWLCEGESGDRQCTSLKDYDVHLLTDALFVNMIQIDINNIDENIKQPYQELLYDRVVELLITISKSSHADKIIDENDCIYKCFKMIKTDNLVDSVEIASSCLKTIPITNLTHNLKKIINLIVNIYINSSTNDTYKTCVNNFYQTGHICEDEIMVMLRENLFIYRILLQMLNYLQNKTKPKIIVTVGLHHVQPLHSFFSKICNTRYVILQDGTYDML